MTIYLLYDNVNFENMKIITNKNDAINMSIKFPESKIIIFNHVELGYIPSHYFYKNGILCKNWFMHSKL
jgi:hypothetical protein